MDIPLLLNHIAKVFNDILKDHLVGVYVHGSWAMNCFNPNKSDLDLLVVVKHPLTRDEQKAFAKQMLLFHDALPSGRGMELSVVLRSSIENFVYPTPFEFHYSDFHREKYQSDENYICGGYTDPDLAAHFTVTYQRGIAILGEPIECVFQPIEKAYYVQSILGDIEEAFTSIGDAPVYYTLNLCRVLMYLREGKVSSKQEGGEWGLQAFPQFHHVISSCLEDYAADNEGTKPKTDKEELERFAEHMLREIKMFA